MYKEHWFVVAGGILSGLIIFGGAVFADLGLSLYQIVLFPSVLAILILLPFMLKKKYRPGKNMLGFCILYGLMASFLVLIEFSPILLGVPVAIIVLLLYTQPLWTAIIAKLLLKEQITRNKIIAIILVILGVIALVNPLTIQEIGSPLGVFLALVGGLGLSGWVIFGRIAGLKKYNPISTKFGYTFFAVVFMLILYPIVSWFIKDQTITSLSIDLSMNIWMYVLLFAIFANLLPHILYFAGAKKIPASSSGIILLLEPITGTLLAAAFLQQPLTWNILLGGALILASNYIVIKEK